MVTLKDKYENEINESINTIIELSKTLENVKNLDEAAVGKEYKINAINSLNEQINNEKKNLFRTITYIAKDDYLHISFVS